MTRSSPQTSSPPAPPRPDAPARGRKRFEVFFASRTGAPRGIAASEARRRSTALRWRAHESSRPVEVVTRPRYLVGRSEEHTSELQSLMRTSYVLFLLKKKTNKKPQ